MAKKVRCAGCGAKNDAASERCRICGSLMTAEVSAMPEHLMGGSSDPMPPTAPVDDGVGPVGNRRPLPPGAAEYFDPAEMEMPAELRPPPGPTRDDPVVSEFEPFDPNALEIGTPADPKPTSNS
jgi:hypothetical protein